MLNRPTYLTLPALHPTASHATHHLSSIRKGAGANNIQSSGARHAPRAKKSAGTFHVVATHIAIRALRRRPLLVPVRALPRHCLHLIERLFTAHRRSQLAAQSLASEYCSSAECCCFHGSLFGGVMAAPA